MVVNIASTYQIRSHRPVVSL